MAIADPVIRHPLDALTTEEIEKVVALVPAENRLSTRARFALLSLHEPPKELVRGFEEGDPSPRGRLLLAPAHDGAIDFEVKATGIMQTCALEPGTESEYDYGAHIAPGLGAMNHQHVFSIRLDMAVDGDRNSVYEVNVERDPVSEQKPHAQAMRARETLLGEEHGAARDVCIETSRYWKVVNPNVENEFGQSTGCALAPGAQAALACDPDSPMARRGGYANHHVGVTRFDRGEMYATGEFPNQSDPDEAPHGLPRWQRQNRSPDNEDVVLWYMRCHSHIPRPEDWPTSMVERAGFTMKPLEFFASTPALDLPGPNHSCHV